MKRLLLFGSLIVPAMLLLAIVLARAADPAAGRGPILSDVLAASKPGDWRSLDPENTLYVELATGRVVIELAPAFAPKHVANVKALARAHYYDGLFIVRAQDNYVVQWGDPDAGRPTARKIEKAENTLPAEFDRAFDTSLNYTRLPDGDVYAPEVGFAGGFPVARDPNTGKIWLVHEYGMLGSARGTGRLGFYEKPEQRVPLKAVRVAADVPEAERTQIEVMRTDSATFQQVIEARRNRGEAWFQNPAGKVEIGNVPIPVRPKPKG